MIEAKVLLATISTTLMLAAMNMTDACACPAGMGLDDTPIKSDQDSKPTGDPDNVFQTQNRTPPNGN